MEFREALEAFQEETKTHRLEGSTGVKNLCRICNALGYKDSQYFGQFHQNGSYGDLINFLEDNSGAIECIMEWMAENSNEEWQEGLESFLPEDEPDESGRFSHMID